MLHKLASQFAVLLGALIVAYAPSSSLAQPEPPARVRWENGRLSVEVGAAPVTSVLEAIGRATGARVQTTGELGTTTPQQFEGLTLEGALRRLVGDHGFIVRYAPPAPGETVPRVLAIRAYAASPPAEGEKDGRSPAGATRRPTTTPQPAQPAARTGENPAQQRSRRIRELIERGDDAGAAELQRMLPAETDAGLRRQIVGALVTIGTPRGVDGLAIALRDAEPDIRSQAARGLWDLEGAASADRLRAARATEQDRSVQRVLDQLLERAQPKARPRG